MRLIKTLLITTVIAGGLLTNAHAGNGGPRAFALTSNAYSVDEGAGHVTVTVTRTKHSNGKGSVSYSTRYVDGASNAAESGTDYDATAGELTFSKGQWTASFDVAVNDNGNDDGDRVFEVYLYDPSTNLTSPSEATVTIVDDDTSSTTETTSSLTVQWSAPTEREDGEPLDMSEIGGYRIYYGTSSDALDNSVEVADAYATSYTIDDLSSDTYYTAVTTYDTEGVESAKSDVHSTTLP
ncbi:Calx-beta domain-containing protein [Arhodomonas sp. AD133]|uniref:Calx-beta domain-containing protein n=1 Tax=Arhodomonas sp. AD133 TaxID=3415009 RepID=UPI003EBD8D02